MKRLASKKTIAIFITGFLILGAGICIALLTAGKTSGWSSAPGLREHLNDSGSADEIRRAKDEILNLLELEQDWGNLTKSEMKQIVENPDSTFTRDWEKLAFNVWVASEAKSNIEAVEKMFAAEGDYRLDNSWDKLTVEVLDWQGVVLEGDSLTAQYVQQNRIERARGLRITPPVQWRTVFERSSDTGQLLISSKLGVDLEFYR